MTAMSLNDSLSGGQTVCGGSRPRGLGLLPSTHAFHLRLKCPYNRPSAATVRIDVFQQPAREGDPNGRIGSPEPVVVTIEEMSRTP